jgi:hypothetical protein
MTQRHYSSIASPTTLSTSISASDTTVAVDATVGYPTSYPFTAALDAGGTAEELVDVTAVSGNVWTVTRGVDGTSAQSHSAGAVVRHSSSGRDFSDMQTHINATTGVHGTTGALVDASSAQTLSNKTLTDPAINAASLTGTLTGTPEFDGAVKFSGSPVFEGAAEGDTALGAQVAADTHPRLAVTAGGGLVFGSGSAAGDATLSRPAAGTLAASGGLETGDDIAVTGRVGATVAASTTAALQAQVAGDSAARYSVDGAGRIGWGSGATTRDTFLYRDASGALKTDGDFRVGGSLAVSGVGANLFAIKTSDTSRASTASPSPDPHLQLQLEANCTYVISGMLIWKGPSGAGITIDWDGPTGTEGWWGALNPSKAATGTATPVRVVAAVADSALGYGWDDDGFGTPFFMPINGILLPASAVTYRLLWSQNTAGATATTVYAKSWLRAERVA